MCRSNDPSVFAVAIVVVLIGAATGVSAEEKKPAPWETPSPAPPPPKLETLRPAADLPSYLGDMIGVWRGKWAGTLDSFIVVRNIDRTHAQVHHSWGTNIIVKQAGYVDIDTNVVGSKLTYTFQEGCSVSFELSPDGKTILGRRYSPGKVVEALYKKVSVVPISVPIRNYCKNLLENPNLLNMDQNYRCIILE